MGDAAPHSESVLRRNNTAGPNWGLLFALSLNAAIWLVALSLLRLFE
jgi:hypothetical protein